MLVGLAFLILAVAGAGASFSWWQDYLRYPSTWGLVGFILVAGFTVGLIILCLYSFVKARSIR
jgi:F0F1-type ATP synthase assembly protein I